MGGKASSHELLKRNTSAAVLSAGEGQGAGSSSAAARLKKKSARELAGPSGLHTTKLDDLQATAVDDLPEYTLAMGSGSAGPGVIEDEGLAQRSTAARQGRMLSRRSQRGSCSASSEDSYAACSDRGSLGEASKGSDGRSSGDRRSSGKRRSSLGVSVDIKAGRGSQGKLGRWLSRRSSGGSCAPSSPTPRTPSYKLGAGSVPDI